MIATELPCRCPRCHFHESEQGHRSILADGSATGCPDSGPLGLILARERRDAGMAATTAAHPDDAARVDAAIESACQSGREFSANDFRYLLDDLEEPHTIGARVRAWAASKRIVCVGSEPSTLPNTNAHKINRYRSAA